MKQRLYHKRLIILVFILFAKILFCYGQINILAVRQDTSKIRIRCVCGDVALLASKAINWNKNENIVQMYGASAGFHHITNSGKYIQLRATLLFDDRLFVNFAEEIYALSYLTGKILVGKGYLAIISAGISINGGQTRGEFLFTDAGGWTKNYEKKPFFTIGIPVYANFSIWNKMPVSLGLSLHGNLNFKFSYIALGINVQAGKIKKLKR